MSEPAFSLSDLESEVMPPTRAAIKARRAKGLKAAGSAAVIAIILKLLPVILPIILQVISLILAKKPALMSALASPADGDIDPAVRFAVEDESR